MRLVIELYHLEGFWFHLEDFVKIVFLHGGLFDNYSFSLGCFLM